MGYIKKNLVKNEELIYQTKLHWWVIVRSLLGAALMIVLLGIFVNPLFSPSSGFITYNTSSSVAIATQTLFCANMLVMMQIFVGMVFILLNYLTSEFGVTNRRVLVKTGVIRRRTLEMNLSKVESFQVKESLPGRLLGFKTLVITGSGGTKQTFSFVKNADKLRKHVVELSTEDNDSRQYGFAPQQLALSAPSSSLRHFRPTLDLPDDDIDNDQALIQEALQAIKSGDLPRARQIVQGLTRTSPQNADVWYLVGYLTGDVSKKRQAYQRAVQLNPNHNKARTALAKL
jgi:hypothetical protein